MCCGRFIKFNREKTLKKLCFPICMLTEIYCSLLGFSVVKLWLFSLYFFNTQCLNNFIWLVCRAAKLRSIQFGAKSITHSTELCVAATVRWEFNFLFYWTIRFTTVLNSSERNTCVLNIVHTHTNKCTQHPLEANRVSWRHFEPIGTQVEFRLRVLYECIQYDKYTHAHISLPLLYEYTFVCLLHFILLLFSCESCTHLYEIRRIVSRKLLLIFIFIFIRILGIHSYSHTIFGCMCDR